MVVDPKSFLSDLFQAAIERAQPEKCIPQYLPETPKGRLIVVGAGKAPQPWRGPWRRTGGRTQRPCDYPLRLQGCLQNHRDC